MTVTEEPPRTDPLAGLTRREREIAMMIPTGMTNQEIAGQLVISRRTVDAHVNSILTKLGLSRRAQVGYVIGGRPVPEIIRLPVQEPILARKVREFARDHDLHPLEYHLFSRVAEIVARQPARKTDAENPE